jgi:hypothetical protein
VVLARLLCVVMRSITENLWVAESRLRYLGVQIGRRMTVVRLASGGLWIHSPAPLDDALRRELGDRGPVKFVVPASDLHGHLFMEHYRDAYPDAQLFRAPGLAQKRTDLTFDGELGSTPDPGWEADIDQAPLDGHRLNEFTFFHRPSRTLIAGDLIFNIGSDWPLLTRLFARGLRLRPRVGPTPLFRSNVPDKQAVRRSIDRILEWDFDRVLPGHGDIIESGGHQMVREGLAGWIAPAA